jgi:hypothetical protein
MTVVALHQTGVLLVDGVKSFPIGFSEAPPIGGTTPNGVPALDELRNAGGTMIRVGPADFATPAAAADWSLPEIDAQIAKVRARMDDAHAHGLHCWLYLGKAPDLPGDNPPANERLLEKIVGAFKDHPSLAAYKGFDEPVNGGIGHQPLIDAHTKIKALDPNHPVVIIQAPKKPASAFTKYRPAFDITGVDIFPVAYPPARHSDSQNTDISVVGDMTTKMVTAAGGKPVWLTLQIAWVGTARSQSKPDVIPCFPTLQQERFMAYHAIVNGARGLTFFGGHMTQTCTPEDAARGWNWSFWRQALKPVVSQLGSAVLKPALLAPDAPDSITSKVKGSNAASDIELVARRAGQFLYVIAVKTGSSGVSAIDFKGLPAGVTKGEVLFEYVQVPPPRPFDPTKQVPRPVTVANRGFSDLFRPHDVHVYRFPLS